MASETLILFPPFRLDVLNAQLWRGAEVVTVRPKPFAVLAYLATHPGRLVPATEKLFMSEKSCVGALNGGVNRVARWRNYTPILCEDLRVIPPTALNWQYLSYTRKRRKVC